MFGPVRSKFGNAQFWLGILLFIAAQAVAARDYQFYESAGARIAYTDDGSGAPVILLHGFQGDFERGLGSVGDFLSPEFRVIGLDQRGHGRSDKPHDADAYGIRMADDVVRLMDQLKIQKAHVVGHSMGGIVALYLAARHPERVQSAATIGNGLFSRAELRLIGWLFRWQFAWAGVKAFFGGPAIPAGEDRLALRLLVGSLKDMTVTEDQAVALKLPVMAMRGGPEDDPRDTVERLASVNPSVRMIRIESENHGSILSNNVFRQELKTFLQRAGGAAH